MAASSPRSSAPNFVRSAPGALPWGFIVGTRPLRALVKDRPTRLYPRGRQAGAGGISLMEVRILLQLCGARVAWSWGHICKAECIEGQDLARAFIHLHCMARDLPSLREPPSSESLQAATQATIPPTILGLKGPMAQAAIGRATLP